MKIALVYLNVSNLGDIIIYETANYIIENILKKNYVKDYEILSVDMGAYKGKTVNNGITGSKKIVRDFVGKVTKNVFFSRYVPSTVEKLMRTMWHMTDLYKYYAQNERPKLKGVDIIIFCGGGLIKFHQQNFYFYIDDITAFAERENIPVLLNAQGIEGYDEAALECQLLKNALNRKCVKYISTRDDFTTLSTCYVTNPDIEIRAVCDPAFWIPETYQVEKSQHQSKKIGINVIRPRIFKQYLYKDITRSFLGELYYDLIKRIYRAGYHVELFSNGVDSDTQFINWLLKKYPDLQENFKVTLAIPKTSKELVHLISGYDRFLAVRLHSAITGTVLGIPNISIVWNRKQILFGQETGLESNFITRENFIADKIFKQLLEAEPYRMNEAYKMSVYQGLEEQLKKWIIHKEESPLL